jgi:hypothetical protein
MWRNYGEVMLILCRILAGAAVAIREGTKAEDRSISECAQMKVPCPQIPVN